VILITAFGDIEMAVEAMKNGAHDFLQSRSAWISLGKSVTRVTEIVAMRRELDHLRQSRNEPSKFSSSATRQGCAPCSTRHGVPPKLRSLC